MTSSSEADELPGEIIVRLDVMLALRKRKAKDVALRSG